MDKSLLLDMIDVVEYDFLHGWHRQLSFEPRKGDFGKVATPYLVVVGLEIEFVKGLAETPLQEFLKVGGFASFSPCHFQEIFSKVCTCLFVQHIGVIFDRIRNLLAIGHEYRGVTHRFAELFFLVEK